MYMWNDILCEERRTMTFYSIFMGLFQVGIICSELDFLQGIKNYST